MLSEHIKQKLIPIKMLIMDVDGTLTDGGMYYTSDGDYAKKFHVRDGMGIVLLHKAGLLSAIITSETTEIVTIRASKLGINHVIMGSRNKKQSITLLAEECSLQKHEIAYIGDDVNDIPCLEYAGFAAITQDAAPVLHKYADFVSNKSGGHGAVREICDMILSAQNKSIILPEEW